MYCTKCGKEIPEGSTVCNNCGNQIKPKKKSNGCLIGCFGCLGVIIVGFLFLLILGAIVSSTDSSATSDNTSSTQTNQKTQSALYKATKNHANPLNVIENKVADDAVIQYNIAKRQGDKIQICVQAGLVAAAYLQAKDEANYNKWQSIKKTDCNNAGIPY